MTIQNPFEYLKEDHKKVAGLLEKLADTSEQAVKTRQETLKKLSDAFMLHAELEEKNLYPVLEETKETHDIALEAEVEHTAAKSLLQQLNQAPVDTEEWLAKLKVLKENIEHHVKEEESEMFPKAEKALDKDTIEQLVQKMNQFMERR